MNETFPTPENTNLMNKALEALRVLVSGLRKKRAKEIEENKEILKWL